MGKHRESLYPVCYSVDFKFQIVDKQKTAAKRYEIERGPDEISQPRYFKNSLTLKMELKNAFGEESLLLFPQEMNGRLWIPSGFIRIGFDWGKSPDS